MKRIYKVGILSLIFILIALWYFQNHVKDHIFIVHNDSMENTIFSGDFVWVSKKIQRDELFQKVCIFQTGLKADNSFYIKRCVGLPGDTMVQYPMGQIKNISRSAKSILPNVKEKYLIWFNSIDELEIIDLANLLNVPTSSFKVNRQLKCLEINLSRYQIQHLEKTFPSLKYSLEYTFFKNSVSESADTIMLSSKQIPLNIEVSQFMSFRESNDPNPEITAEKHYQNYYYFVGDNREVSIDSRKWGPIPEANFVGSVKFILFSWDSKNKKIRWRRFFKSI